MIRYSQIGARDRLLACKEIWLCYYCGECSDTCPRQAEPGEFMASTRRYMIASLDPTGISRYLYSSKLFTFILITLLSILFALVFLSGNGSMQLDSLDLFKFIPFEIIHNVGIAVIALACLTGLVGIVSLIKKISYSASSNGVEKAQKRGLNDLLKSFIFAVKNVFSEITTEKRYRECDENEPQVPWYRSRWFIHWSIMWGFIGLAAATGLDYFWMLIGEKIPGQADPLWWPNRLLGNLFGLSLIYGTSLAIYSRIKRPDKYSSHSLHSDWLFLWLLIVTGLSGFIVELSLYLPMSATWVYVIFLIHVVLGMEVVFLLPFTKFAHAMYHPLALLIYHYKKSEESISRLYL